jgi:hypothetical protein
LFFALYFSLVNGGSPAEEKEVRKQNIIVVLD